MAGHHRVDDRVRRRHRVQVTHQAGCAETGVVARDDRVALLEPVVEVLDVAFTAGQRRGRAVVTEADGAVRPRHYGPAAVRRITRGQEDRRGADRRPVVSVGRGVEDSIRGTGGG